MPVPERATVCGDPVALSAMFSVAARVPVAAGLKVTEIVQEALAARDDPQVLVWLKSDALVPPIEIARELRVAVPPFVTVALCAVAAVPALVEANFRAVAERVTWAPPPLRFRRVKSSAAIRLRYRQYSPMRFWFRPPTA